MASAIGLRRARRAKGRLPAAAASRPHHHHGAVGAAAPTPAPASIVPPGLVPIFAGWNVWDIWQADKPSFDVIALRETLQRQLQVWIQNQIKDNAPCSPEADPRN